MNEKIRRWLIIIISTILSIVINIGVNHLVIFILHVPLFLDTVGTVTLTFFCGWIPGLVCAFATTLLDSIIGGYFLQLPTLYVICSFSAVFISYKFKRNIFNTNMIIVRICYLFILAMIMCVVISILGGIIDSICITYSNYKSTYPVASDFFKPNFIKLGFSQLGINIVSRFPINIVDRLFTCFISYGLSLLFSLLVKQDNKGNC
mgnify:FL=1